MMSLDGRFSNNVDHSGTVKGEWYRGITNLDNMWFQQDGATCHTATQTGDLPK